MSFFPLVSWWRADIKALGIGPSPLRRTWPEAQSDHSGVPPRLIQVCPNRESPPLSFQQEDKDQPLDFGVAYFQIFETIGTSKTIDYVMVFLRVRVRLAWCIQANLVHPRIVRVQPHPLAKMRGEPAANQQSSKNQYRHENYRTQATKMHMIWPPKLRGHWMWHGLACHILRTSHTASRGAP